MEDNLIFSESEIGFLRELTKNRVRFMLVGLSAAALQGAPVVTQDVDLWFEDMADAGIKKALKRVGASYVPPIEDNPPMFAGKGVELFDVVVHMHGLMDFSREYKNTLDLKVGKTLVKVLKLERIIKSKEAAKRPKDKLSLPVLRDALKVINYINRKK